MVKEEVHIFNSMFWGLLFLFDYRVGQVDILPDLFGYILMFNGLKHLEPFHDLFGSAKKVAIVLMAFSIFHVYVFLGWFVFSIVFHLVYMVLNMVFMYRICFAIVKLAQAADLSRLAHTASFRCSLYLTSALFTPIIIILGFFQPQLAGMVFFPAFLFSAIVLALLMVLMRQANEALNLNPYG